jgi:twitching motility protein PilT
MSTNPDTASLSSTGTHTARTASGNASAPGPKRVDEYLKEVLTKGGSDLHFIAGEPPRIRLHGELQPLRNDLLEPQLVEELLREIMPRLATQRLEEKNGADFAHIIPGISRFRVNIMRQLNGLGAVFRAIPSKAKSLDDLKMPDAVRNLCKLNSGLILVTGKTGSGKSTTLAAMIDDINTRMKGHIVTIEDPIEFVHQRKNCLISQREIGLHTASFANALHSALREDPDVILVGEMRDYETISIAVTAAEMGILVMGTLHTNGAAPTVDRVINSFPADKQAQVRAMLSTSLRGVVSQQLIPTKGKPGRVAAMEIMVNTPAIANLIRQGKIDQLENTIQSGGAMGMRTMDSAIQELFDKAFISGRNAYLKAMTKSKFEAVKDQN